MAKTMLKPNHAPTVYMIAGHLEIQFAKNKQTKNKCSSLLTVPVLMLLPETVWSFCCD